MILFNPWERCSMPQIFSIPQFQAIIFHDTKQVDSGWDARLQRNAVLEWNAILSKLLCQCNDYSSHHMPKSLAPSLPITDNLGEYYWTNGFWVPLTHISDQVSLNINCLIWERGACHGSEVVINRSSLCPISPILP